MNTTHPLAGKNNLLKNVQSTVMSTVVKTQNNWLLQKISNYLNFEIDLSKKTDWDIDS